MCDSLCLALVKTIMSSQQPPQDGFPSSSTRSGAPSYDTSMFYGGMEMPGQLQQPGGPVDPTIPFESMSIYMQNPMQQPMEATSSSSNTSENAMTSGTEYNNLHALIQQRLKEKEREKTSLEVRKKGARGSRRVNSGRSCDTFSRQHINTLLF